MKRSLFLFTFLSIIVLVIVPISPVFADAHVTTGGWGGIFSSFENLPCLGGEGELVATVYPNAVVFVKGNEAKWAKLNSFVEVQFTPDDPLLPTYYGETMMHDSGKQPPTLVIDDPPFKRFFFGVGESLLMVGSDGSEALIYGPFALVALHVREDGDAGRASLNNAGSSGLVPRVSCG